VPAEGRLNVAADGKTFRCDFIREGPVDYSDIGKGIECLRRGTIERALQSFVGKPLTIRHVDLNLDPATIPAIGRINSVGYDKDEGWFYCEGSIDSDEGREAARTLNPSCGYKITDKGPAGRWNNIPYNQELTGIEFHHLALCPGRSRYEESDFRLNAVTNNNGEITMFKFIKTIAAAVAGGKPVTEEVEIPADTVIKIGDQEVRLNALVDAKTAQDAAAAKKTKDEADAKLAAEAGRANAITDATEIVLPDGKKTTVGDLKTAYEARENAVKAEAETARLNALKGKADFEKLQQAASTGGTLNQGFSQTAGTLAEGLKRGKY
jgi:hypothetical protein